MKKALLFAGIISIFASCTNVIETEEYKTLQAKTDSLEAVTDTQDSEIVEYLMEFNNIQENLNVIKEKENIISLNKSGIEENNNRDQITEDINTIYGLLLENKQKLSALSKKFKKSNSKNKELKRLIETLNTQIELKNKEIIALNKELEYLNIEIKDLTDELLAVQTENETKSELIEKQDEALHTAFYVVGNKKELKDNKVISKEGGFLGIGKNTKLDNSFDPSYFTEINTKEFTKIAIYAKKAKLITTHPDESYKFEGNDKKVDNLVILDSDKFWSVSKYLVVEISQ
jgi:seryl-tRNA synthetase